MEKKQVSKASSGQQTSFIQFDIEIHISILTTIHYKKLQILAVRK